METDSLPANETALDFSEHQTRVLGRYGGPEFKARMKSFPDGYHNLGYWIDGCDRMAASKALIDTAVAQLALAADDSVLDVGAGVGRGTIDLYQRHGCRRVVGIDLTPENIEHARHLARAEGCSDGLEFRLMSATRLDFADASFDKILSVDSAIHFDTREQFFREAFRVLKPGGVLVIADTCINYRALNWPWRRATSLLLKLWCVPPENIQDMEDCRLTLARQRFSAVTATSIGERTLAPVCDYFMSSTHWQLAVASEGYKEAFTARLVFGLMKFAYRRKLVDYALLIAHKS